MNKYIEKDTAVLLNISENVSFLQKKKNVSATEVATEIGISRKQYLRIKNLKGNYNLWHLINLAKYFGCTVDYLITPHFQEVENV